MSVLCAKSFAVGTRRAISLAREKSILGFPLSLFLILSFFTRSRASRSLSCCETLAIVVLSFFAICVGLAGSSDRHLRIYQRVSVKRVSFSMSINLIGHFLYSF